MCGDSSVAEKWINGHRAIGYTYRRKIIHMQKNFALHALVVEKIAYPVTQIDDHVKHSFLGHNQEADGARLL